METRQRSRRTNSSRKPLSDCTNTVNSSQSSSASTSTIHKPQNPFLSSLIPKLLSHSNTNSTTTVSNSSASTSQNDDASNTGDLLLQSLDFTPSRPTGKVDRETNSVYSRRAASQKRKKGTPAEHISSNLGKTKENEDKNLPKARTAPRKKRHESSRTDVNKSPTTDVSKSALPQEFIEQQKAYYAEIDAFELPEEEVESIYDLE